MEDFKIFHLTPFRIEDAQPVKLSYQYHSLLYTKKLMIVFLQFLLIKLNLSNPNKTKENKMTRKEDKIRDKTESARKDYNLRSSRVQRVHQKNRQDHEEKVQETNILGRVAELPDELIRLVYAFMSGNAKIIFNPRYSYLRDHFDSFDFQLDLEKMFEKMTNTQILDIIYTGTLRVYPEIVAMISYDYYYSLIDDDFHTVRGYHALNLWATERLSYDFMQDEYTMTDSAKKDVDRNMRMGIASAVKTYISNIRKEYSGIHRRVCFRLSPSLKKNQTPYSYRDLFLRLEKAVHLYRVASQYFEKPVLPMQTPKPLSTDLYPFTDELLIPTPLSMPIQT